MQCKPLERHPASQQLVFGKKATFPAANISIKELIIIGKNPSSATGGLVHKDIPIKDFAVFFSFFIEVTVIKIYCRGSYNWCL